MNHKLCDRAYTIVYWIRVLQATAPHGNALGAPLCVFHLTTSKYLGKYMHSHEKSYSELADYFILQNTIRLSSEKRKHTEFRQSGSKYWEICDHLESFGNGVSANLYEARRKVSNVLSPATSWTGTASEICCASCSVSFTLRAPIFSSRFLILVVPADVQEQVKC